MASVRCPDCAASVNVPEEELGYMVRCPECGKKFAAEDGPGRGAVKAGTPGAPKAARTGRRRDWGDEDEAPPVSRGRKSGRNTLLLVGGILLAVLLVCGGVATVAGIFIVRTIRENEARQEMARQQVRLNQERQRLIQQQMNQERQQQMNKRVPPPLDEGARKVPAIALDLGPGNAIAHQGVLTNADPRFANKPFKSFEVDLQAGRRYQIELASQQMDSFLRLYGPGGEPLLENDDFKGLDSGIAFTPDRAGKYQVHATVLTALRNDMPAPFTLTIRAD